jgi:hypothetical protein
MLPRLGLFLLIPTEVWNRLGRTLIPKLKTGNELVMKLDVSVQVESDMAQSFL